MFKNATAAELADMLEWMERHRHNAGGMSLLDDATFAFGDKDPQIAEAQKAFSDAAYRHKRSYTTDSGDYSAAAWDAAMTAARNLAGLLRPLGEFRIPRCERKRNQLDTCTLPLDEDGVCRSPLGHIDD